MLHRTESPDSPPLVLEYASPATAPRQWWRGGLVDWVFSVICAVVLAVIIGGAAYLIAYAAAFSSTR